jgi:4-hydroxy-tetrahydrodipicolinate synthase
MGLLPVLRAFSRVGGVVFSKTALRLRGYDIGDPRLPLPPAGEEQVAAIAADLAEAGVRLAEKPGVVEEDLLSRRVDRADLDAAYVATTTHTSAGTVRR